MRSPKLSASSFGQPHGLQAPAKGLSQLGGFATYFGAADIINGLASVDFAALRLVAEELRALLLLSFFLSSSPRGEAAGAIAQSLTEAAWPNAI